MSENGNREKLYYSIGEVARMLDVQTSAVRYWEKEFDILKPRKNRKGNRMFTPEDLKNIRIIHHLLKDKGMTIAGAKKKMSENPESINNTMEVIESLQKIRGMLTDLKDSM